VGEGVVRSAADIERAWQVLERSPKTGGVVRLITLRLGGGRHECPPRVIVSPELGVHGDRWGQKRKHFDAQVTMMNARVAELLAAGIAPLDAPGDNFLVDLDIGEEALPVGSRVRIGSAIVEITALPHTGCNKFSQRLGAAALEWVNAPPNRALRLRGVNCRVVAIGEVAVGDLVKPA
jgi:MOSC domain-containing protein YiiM